GGSEVTELSGSGHDSSYYDDRSDHERERHKEKKKKKKKKSEKEKEKHLDDEERRKRKEEKKRKREKEQCDTEGETDDFDPGKKVEVEPPPDRPVRACRTQPAENESTPIQQLLEHFLRQLQRKDPHGFFALPVTDTIAPGYSMIIKHPMDFGTMKDKIAANEYKSVTEFKADFKLMCDNAMTYNRPDTVYYKLAKKILHTGFKMMSKQAALLGDEDTAVEEPVPEVVPVQVETAKKSKKPSKEVIRTTVAIITNPFVYSSFESFPPLYCIFNQVGESIGDSNTSVLDFLSVKPYSDVSLDISMLSSLGKVKKELDHDDNHLHLDETTKLLQDLHEAQTDRVGSRPSSNLSSLSNTSDREQHHLGSPSHLSVGEQQDMVHDPYEFLQSPEPANATSN
uniref:Bromodomain containing 9 n=1 Tax=Pelusios castaneus TaxID=367368 RepID=A0A8C8RC98_9SAUR